MRAKHQEDSKEGPYFEIDNEKDLRVSYLQQYELNGYHEVSRQQTRNTLKDITDKYGFYWDEKGRLIKNTVTKKSIEKNTTTAKKIKITKDLKNKQNWQIKKPKLEEPNPLVNEGIKYQIKSINDKINSIVSKYQTKRTDQKKINNLFCQCDHRTRMLTEEDPIESPCFKDDYRSGASQAMNRSKSVNYLIKPKIMKYEKEESRLTPNKSFHERRRIGESPETKKIDCQIQRINKRIKECEREKQKLSINFKRFQVRQKSRSPVRMLNLEQNLSPVDRSFEKSTRIKKESIFETKVKQELTVKKPTVMVPKKLEKHGIIEKLCRQIQLDEQFRNAKLWFENNEDPHKWGILADKLAVGMGLTELKYHELVDKFSCSLQEHNPFFSAKNSYESYASLLSVYIQDERHWNQQIQNKFTLQKLESEEFTVEELDVEHKGFIRIEDLVRYINMRTKNFYRTRDLLLIFRRFGGKQKKQVHFSRILEVFLS